MSSPTVLARARPARASGSRVAVLGAGLVWWSSRRRRGRDLARPLREPVPLGRHRLPGTSAETALYEALDAYDRPFAMVVAPASGHASLALRVEPPAGDRPEAEPWIAALGVWLALLGHEPGLAGCAVVLAPGAAPGSSDRIPVVVQLTWRLRGPQGRTDAAALGAELGARLPHVVQGLGRCEVGAASPLRAADLIRTVARAYGADPADPDPASWAGAAPRAAVEGWDRLHHAGETSLTWCLSDVPPALVLSGVLAQLGAARGAARGARTRVTLLLRPDAPVIEVADGRLGPGPAQPPELTSLVTVSVAGGSGELDGAVQAVLTGVAPSLRPWLRPLYGTQAAAFAAAVPSGTLLGEHTAPPTVLREVEA
jgi:hypothetical protein